MKATILPLLLWAGAFAECGSKWAGDRSPELNRFPSLVVGMEPVWGRLPARGTVSRRLVKLSFRDPRLKGFLLTPLRAGEEPLVFHFCVFMFSFFKRPPKLCKHQVPPKSACMGQKRTVLLLGAACLADSSLIYGIGRGEEEVLGIHGVPPTWKDTWEGGRRVPRAGPQTLR